MADEKAAVGPSGLAACRRAAERVLQDVRSRVGGRADLVGVVAGHEVVTVTVEVEDGFVSWAFPAYVEEEEAAVAIAEGLQYEIERRVRLPWPACGDSLIHSPIPSVQESVAVWACRRHGILVRIGALPPDAS